MKLLTQKAFATLRKVSAPYINKLVRQGRIKLTRGKVNPRQADKALAALRPERSKIRLGRNRKPARSPRRRSAPATSPGRPAGGSATSSLTKNKAEREGWQAKLARIEYERAAGNYLLRSEVLEALRRVFSNLRTQFRRMPRAQAMRLVNIPTPAEVERILGPAVDDVLLILSEDVFGEKNPAPPAVEEAPPPDALQTSAPPAEVRA